MERERNRKRRKRNGVKTIRFPLYFGDLILLHKLSTKKEREKLFTFVWKAIESNISSVQCMMHKIPNLVLISAFSTFLKKEKKRRHIPDLTLLVLQMNFVPQKLECFFMLTFAGIEIVAVYKFGSRVSTLFFFT